MNNVIDATKTPGFSDSVLSFGGMQWERASAWSKERVLQEAEPVNYEALLRNYFAQYPRVSASAKRTVFVVVKENMTREWLRKIQPYFDVALDEDSSEHNNAVLHVNIVTNYGKTFYDALDLLRIPASNIEQGVTDVNLEYVGFPRINTSETTNIV